MSVDIEKNASVRAKGTDHKAERVPRRPNVKTCAQGESPYTVKSIDGAIAHLEIVITVDDDIAVFGRRYWIDRVQQIALTPGILQSQVHRLNHLLGQLADESPGTYRRVRASSAASSDIETVNTGAIERIATKQLR
jgi:hypothetical protein